MVRAIVVRAIAVSDDSDLGSDGEIEPDEAAHLDDLDDPYDRPFNADEIQMLAAAELCRCGDANNCDACIDGYQM